MTRVDQCCPRHELLLSQVLAPILNLDATSITQEGDSRVRFENLFQSMDTDGSKRVTLVNHTEPMHLTESRMNARKNG